MESLVSFFFFNDTATTEIYTLSLHDALPISADLERAGEVAGIAIAANRAFVPRFEPRRFHVCVLRVRELDRKSTRLNSSHSQISYAVFCLKKKKKNETRQSRPYVDPRSTADT